MPLSQTPVAEVGSLNSKGQLHPSSVPRQPTADEYGRQLEEIENRALRQRLKDGNWDYDDDAGTLTVANIVYLALSLIGACRFLYGLFRKFLAQPCEYLSGTACKLADSRVT